MILTLADLPRRVETLEIDGRCPRCGAAEFIFACGHRCRSCGFAPSCDD